MKFFKPEEFTCKCGNSWCNAPKEIKPHLASALDALRAHYGRPLIVTSGLRCPARNADAGGKPDSEHLTGEGADLLVHSSRDRFQLYQAALACGFRRLGVGKNFLHVGVAEHLDQDVTWIY